MEVYTGIDWSESKHDVAFMNEAGAILAQITIPHTPDGFQRLDATRQKLDVAADECLVGLETSHNLLIDFPPRVLVAGCGHAGTPRYTSFPPM